MIIPPLSSALEGNIVLYEWHTHTFKRLFWCLSHTDTIIIPSVILSDSMVVDQGVVSFTSTRGSVRLTNTWMDAVFTNLWQMRWVKTAKKKNICILHFHFLTLCSSLSILHDSVSLFPPQSECWIEENERVMGEENWAGEVYHSDSRCFFSNLSREVSVCVCACLSKDVSYIRVRVRDIPPEASRVKCLAQGHIVFYCLSKSLFPSLTEHVPSCRWLHRGPLLQTQVYWTEHIPGPGVWVRLDGLASRGRQ